MWPGKGRPAAITPRGRTGKSGSTGTTEGEILDEKRCVLIVDPSPETREVLQLALERRGVRTLAAGRTPRALQLARQHQPDLIVLDVDVEPAAAATLSERLAEDARGPQPRMILLGSAAGPEDAGRDVVPKPYDYRALIRRIEELVQVAPEAGAQRAW